MFLKFSRYITYTLLLAYLAVFSDTTGIYTGSTPLHATITQEKLYIINSDSNSVTVVDAKTNKILATTPAGFSPLSAAATGDYLYVNNSVGKTVTVINTKNDTIEQTISTPKGAYYSFVNGAYLYVIGDDYVTVINISTQSVIREQRTKGGAINQNFNFANNNKVYLHNPTDRYVSVYNKGSQWIGYIDIDKGSSDSVLVGRTLYVVVPRFGQVILVNTDNNQTVKDDSGNDDFIISVGQKPEHILNIGTKLYVNNTLDNTISVIDVKKNAVTKTISVGENPSWMTLVDSMLIVLNSNDNTLSVIDTSTDNVVAVLPTGIHPVSSVQTDKYLYVINSQSNSITPINIDIPHLLEVNSSTNAGTYKEDDKINIFALFDKNILPGSSLKVVLNNNREVILDKISGKKLTGEYIIQAGDTISKLTIKSIQSVNMKTIADIPVTAYHIPGDKNLGNFKNIVIKTTNSSLNSAPDLTCKKPGNLYRTCPPVQSVGNFALYTSGLLCEGIVDDALAERSRKRLSRYDVIGMALNMNRLELVDSSNYRGSFEDVTRNMYPVVQTALDQGFISDGTMLNPSKNVTRLEAYTLLMKGVCLAPEPQAGKDWSRLVYDAASQAGVTKLTWERFRPQNRASKREVFVLASRLADWADKTGGCQTLNICR